MDGSITKSIMYDTFHYHKIGSIEYIDIHARQNSNGRIYKFAFVSIYLYDTTEAYAFQINIENHLGGFPFVYREPRYWEIKKYISYHDRMLELWKKLNTDFTKECNDDYKMMEREISGLTMNEIY